MKIRDVGEIGLIKHFARKIRLDASVVKGSGDDAAVLKWTKDKYLLLTCDMLIEGVHFTLNAARPSEIGRKALARNISDIAAMGGVPRHAVVSLGIDPDKRVDFADRLVDGMVKLAGRYGVNLVGGDVARSSKLVIDVALTGEVEKRNVVYRSNARPGDLIMVTGSVGGSGKGRHLNFTPRLDEARWLVKNFRINSMIDISDGLVIDLGRILDASLVGGRIHENLIPVSKEAENFDSAISEGEDFELLFTMAPKEAKRLFRTRLDSIDTPVTLIGEITARRDGYVLIRPDGTSKKLKAEGYTHF